MWTQRDQIQAYQFLRRRLVSALVTADANHPTSPSRRLVLGTVIGVAATVLITAVFGVVGLLNPSAPADWRQGGQVIVERETGARYILGQDGLLHPVLNFASARLLAGGNGNQTVTVPAKTLGSASRGALLGIPGAPDSLPAADSLTSATFIGCTRTPPDLPVAAEPVSTMILAANAPAGRAFASGQGTLVATRAGDSGHATDEYLITNGHRFHLAGPEAVNALGWGALAPLIVSANWLNTVPAGRDLGLVAVANVGATGPSLGGTPTRVGQVLKGGGTFYKVVRDGLAQISETEADLIVGNPATAPAYPNGAPAVIPVSVAAVDGAPRVANAPGTGTPADFPHALPTVLQLTTGAVLCAVGDGRDSATILVTANLPLPADAKVMPVTAPTDDRVADEVFVPPSSGTLVREQVGTGTGTGTTYLVTDAGMKYPVPTPDAVGALGYAGVTPRPVAGTLLALLPTGPPLDPVAARRTVGTAGGVR